jgi:hypothetical protein
LPGDQVKKIIKRHGFDHSTEITRDKYEVICENIGFGLIVDENTPKPGLNTSEAQPGQDDGDFLTDAGLPSERAIEQDKNRAEQPPQPWEETK